MVMRQKMKGKKGKRVKSQIKKVSKPTLTKNGKRRGRPPSKPPRNARARRIEERDEFYKPPVEGRPAKCGTFMGYCFKCGAMITSNDKEGRRFRCTDCERLLLKSELCPERESRYGGRREKDDEPESDHQDHMTAIPVKKVPKISDDEDNPHNKMVR